ncbi:hypothetical protein SAMN05216464_1112 [Mucilaginibacter pineti]|uniref:Uncharacterized protein n=1 Tax=Mucilaginibacter pineti TaxID=1391627 RepID=A0A1G7H0W6_9SPHI|nr:hypothetical protein [Mucilaginibacter pineti]SDE93964.1 hypothetical protein SAMN05216464_1112 [Mucilaginibacter pineti]
MNIVKQIGRKLFSKDTDQRVARSLNKVKEADQITENINNRLSEIQKSFKLKTAKL